MWPSGRYLLAMLFVVAAVGGFVLYEAIPWLITVVIKPLLRMWIA